jgi:uncharacterized membrane protein
MVLVLLTAWTQATDAQPFFTGLGDLKGGQFSSVANAVSADGSTVVGTSMSQSGYEAFYWIRQGGLVGLGDLAGGLFFSRPYAVSSSGSTVAGGSISALGEESFRWSAVTGSMEALGDLPGGDFRGAALAVSPDGETLYGGSWSHTGFSAFRWTAATGLEPITGLPGAASGVSADGSIIAGYISPGTVYDNRVFRWTSESGTLWLGDLPGIPVGGSGTEFADMSANGSVIVGVSVAGEDNVTEAFRWTTGEGMQRIEGLTPWHMTAATAVSGDGKIVAIDCYDEHSSLDPHIWSEADGLRSLTRLLASHKLAPTGWSQMSITDLSYDGLTLVGRGMNPEGNIEGWIARLPEPHTLLLLIVGAVAMLARERRQSATSQRLSE